MSDDSSMLWFNSLSDTAFTQAPGTRGIGSAPVQNPVTLTAGSYYPITLGYMEGAGGWGLQVYYTPPGGTQTLVPLSVLFAGSANLHERLERDAKLNDRPAHGGFLGLSIPHAVDYRDVERHGRDDGQRRRDDRRADDAHRGDNL